MLVGGDLLRKTVCVVGVTQRIAGVVQAVCLAAKLAKAAS